MEIKDLREFQKKQLILLQKINDICVKNNLRYYLIGGTLLGAVRNKGFIPWDFDLDIAMPRSDYSQLSKYIDSNDSTFFYEDYRSEKYHNSPHALLRVKNTKVIFKRLRYIDSKKKCTGMFLDIFPLDFAPDNLKEQKKQAKKIKLIKTILYFKESQVADDTKVFKNFLKRVVSIILLPLSFKFLSIKLEKIQTKYNSKCSKYLVSMSSHYSYEKQLLEKEIYGRPTPIFFEENWYYGPENVDAYLKKIYGDYKKLPPIDKRFSEINDVTFIDNRE